MPGVPDEAMSDLAAPYACERIFIIYPFFTEQKHLMSEMILFLRSLGVKGGLVS